MSNEERARSDDGLDHGEQVSDESNSTGTQTEKDDIEPNTPLSQINEEGDGETDTSHGNRVAGTNDNAGEDLVKSDRQTTENGEKTNVVTGGAARRGGSALRESEAGVLLAVQVGRAVFYLRDYCRTGGERRPLSAARRAALDFAGSVFALWVVWGVGALSDAAVRRALIAVLASWAAVSAFWASAAALRADPGFRVAASTTVVLLVLPVFWAR